MKGAFRRILVMTGLNTRRTFRSLDNLLWILVVPIVFSLIIASFFSGQDNGSPTVYVVDEDGSTQARAFVEELAASSIEVRDLNREQAVDGLAGGEYELVVVIPKDFGEQTSVGTPRLEMMHGPGYSSGPVEVRAKAVAHALATGEPVPTSELKLQSPRDNSGGQDFAKVRTAFGIYLVFAFSALFVRGGAVHQAREDGTLQRMVASGVAYGEVVAAHVASIFLVGVVQAVIILTVTGSMGILWLTAGWGVLIVTMIGTLLVGSGLAICLSGLTRSATLMQGLAGGLPPLLAMIGGAFFPLEVAPVPLQQAARINPIYWAIELLAEGYIYQGVLGQMIPFTVLLLIGILGMVVGLQGLRRVEL